MLPANRLTSTGAAQKQRRSESRRTIRTFLKPSMSPPRLIHNARPIPETSHGNCLEDQINYAMGQGNQGREKNEEGTNYFDDRPGMSYRILAWTRLGDHWARQKERRINCIRSRSPLIFSTPGTDRNGSNSRPPPAIGVTGNRGSTRSGWRRRCRGRPCGDGIRSGGFLFSRT